MMHARIALVPGLLAAAAALAVSTAFAGPVLRLEVGPERIVCGVTAPAAPAPSPAAPAAPATPAAPASPGIGTEARKLGLIIWFHGGMRSQNREKGLEAHRPLLAFADTARFVLASASAFEGRDWLGPAALGTVDALIDTLRALYPLGDDLRLVGVSDGCLGVIRYALAGKRRAGQSVLISSLPGLAVTEDGIRRNRRLQEGRWDFLQGGQDRLFPAREVIPFLEAWERVNPNAHLHFYPEGEHDFAYYATHAAGLLQGLLAPTPLPPNRKKPKKD